MIYVADAANRLEGGCLTITECDRAGLVEQQRVDVARSLDRAAGHREHVESNKPIHAAMPIAESSALIVVGISVTNKATSTMMGMLPPA